MAVSVLLLRGICCGLLFYPVGISTNERSPPADHCDADIGEFYSKAHHKCVECDTCQNGFGRDFNTRIRRNHDGQPLECYRCTECPEGMYSDDGSFCGPCRQCSKLNRIVDQSCSSTQNAVCRGCIEGHYDYYSIEEGFVDTIKPCRDCALDTTGVDECSTVQKHDPSKGYTVMWVIIGLSGALVILVGLGCFCHRRCPLRRTRGNQVVISDTPDTDTTDSDDQLLSHDYFISSKDTDQLLESPTVAITETRDGSGVNVDHGVVDAEISKTDEVELEPEIADLDMDFGTPEHPNEPQSFCSVGTDNTIPKSIYLPTCMENPVTGSTMANVELNSICEEKTLITEEHLHEVTKHLSQSQVGELLRKLQLSNADTVLDNLKHQYSGRELVYQALLAWSRELGMSASVKALIHCLEGVQRKDIADKLRVHSMSFQRQGGNEDRH